MAMAVYVCLLALAGLEVPVVVVVSALVRSGLQYHVLVNVNASARAVRVYVDHRGHLYQSQQVFEHGSWPII